jgi:hypothetical protein
MGISWAPHIAQCAAWSILMHEEDGDEWIYKISRDELLMQSPSFMELKSEGFITLYLDNIFVCGVDREVKILEHRIKRNCKIFNVTLKEDSYVSAEDWNKNPVTYLGVEIIRRRVETQRSGSRKNPAMPTKEGAKYLTKWRQIEAKAQAWSPVFEQLRKDDQRSYRDLARCIGRLMWYQSISRRPKCRVRHVINVLSDLASHRHANKKGWDDTYDIPHEEMRLKVNTILTESEIVQRNDWILGPDRAVDCDSTIFACSDSSKKGWGYVNESVSEELN